MRIQIEMRLTIQENGSSGLAVFKNEEDDRMTEQITSKACECKLLLNLVPIEGCGTEY